MVASPVNNEFQIHVPDYLDGVRPPPQPFNTLEELLAIKQVVGFSEHPTFEGFFLSDQHLMSVFDEGFGWWVVGTIKYPDLIDLPFWAGWRFRALLGDGSQVILEDGDVVSSCGEVLTLVDGSHARNLGYARKAARKTARKAT